MKPYRELYPLADLVLPNTNRVAELVVVLPTGTTITAEIIDSVVSVVRTLIESTA